MRRDEYNELQVTGLQVEAATHGADETRTPQHAEDTRGCLDPLFVG